MSGLYPSTPSPLYQWQWLLAHPFHTNGSLDTCLQLSLAKRFSEEDGWFARAFKWWAAQTTSPKHHDMVDVDDRWGRPPRAWCPFPIANLSAPHAGQLAFITGKGHRHWHTDTLPDESNEAAILKDVNDCAELRPVQFRFVLPTDAPFRGTSYALAALVALLSKELSLDVPHDVAATGGWDVDKHSFVPVPIETLQSKFDLLHKWGYRRVLVVAGQPLADLDTHRMLLGHIPQEPTLAISELITELWGSLGHERYAKYCDALQQSQPSRWWVDRSSTRKAFNYWLDEAEGPRVFWLHGVAGIGKSQMLAKLREELDADGQFPCYTSAANEPLDAFFERAARFVAEWYHLPPLDLHHASHAQVFLETSRAASAVSHLRSPPILMVDGLECLSSQELHAFIDLLVQLQETPLRMVLSAESLPPSQLTVYQYQLAAMTIREIYDMLLASVGRPRLVRLATHRFPEAADQSAAIESLLRLLHHITKGLPIFLDLMCEALCDNQRDWLPNVNADFEKYAGDIVATRLRSLEDKTMSLEVLSILLAADSSIPEGAIVGAIRKGRPGKRNIERLTRDVLARLRFAVYSWRQDGEMAFRVSHPLFARAMKSIVEADNLADAKRDLAKWCADVGSEHSHPYALQHGPRHLLGAMEHAHQASECRAILYQLARDQVLLQSLRADPTIDALTITGFIRAAFETARESGRVGEGVEFALQLAQVNGAILEDFDILRRAARNSLREIAEDIQNGLSGVQQRALASLVIAVQWLHAWRLGTNRELLSLLERFFNASDQNFRLTHKFRDAATPLMAAVLCGCARDLGEQELGEVAQMLLNTLDKRRSIACGQATIYQSACIHDGDVCERLRRITVGVVTSKWEREVQSARSSVEPPGVVSLEVAVQRLVKALLRVGDTAAATAVLHAHPRLQKARHKWIAVDIIEGGQFGKEPDVANQLYESAFRSWRDESSQGLVARAAVEVAHRESLPHWDLESELLHINALCMASPWMEAEHKAKTLARLAVQSASGDCRTLSHKEIDEAFNMALAITEPRGQLQTCLSVASYTRQIANKRPLHFDDIAVKQLSEIERILLECAERAAKSDIATCAVETLPGSAPEPEGVQNTRDALAAGGTECAVAATVMPLEVVLQAQAELAKAWAHCGDLSRATSVVFNGELSALMNTASTRRGDALAEIAMKALDFNAGFHRLVQRSPKHRLTVVSRVLGRLCERGEYARAAALVSDEMKHALAWDGAKAWATDLVTQAGELRRSLSRNQACLPPTLGVVGMPGDRMWGHLDYALLATCGGYAGAHDIANAVLDTAWAKYNDRLSGVDLAVFGHELCAHGRESEGRRAFGGAIAKMRAMKIAAAAGNRFRLEGELLERLALCGDGNQVEVVLQSFWSHADSPSVWDNRRDVSLVAYRFARSVILDRSRLEPVGLFVSEVRRQMRLRLDNPGPDMMPAASAVLRAARGQAGEAESMASEIRNERVRIDTLGDIAKVYLLADQIEDVRRIAFSDLQGKQIKALVRLILSSPSAQRDRRKLLLALLEPASRFLDSAAWCAAGLIMVDQSITDDEIERIVVTSSGGRDTEVGTDGIDQEG